MGYFILRVELYCLVVVQVFDELMLDTEWSVNAGNWLWLSCSGFFHKQVPVYCPVTVAKKLDPTGNFIRCVYMILNV